MPIFFVVALAPVALLGFGLFCFNVLARRRDQIEEVMSESGPRP